MRRSIGIGAAAVMMLLALSGCGPANPAPKPFDPSAGPTVSGTVSDTRSDTGDAAPTMPEAAMRDDVVGAKAFVRYYFDLVSYSLATGDVAPVRELSSGKCESCRGFMKVVDQRYQAGGRFEGKGSQARDLAGTQRTGDVITIEGVLTLFPQVDFVGPSATPKRLAREDHQAKFTLTRTSAGWVMAEWAFRA